MAVAQPQEETFKGRLCQVYYYKDLSYDAKKYLGMIHNRIGETRQADSTKEQVNLVIYSDPGHWELIFCRSELKLHLGSTEFLLLFIVVVVVVVIIIIIITIFKSITSLIAILRDDIVHNTHPAKVLPSSLQKTL